MDKTVSIPNKEVSQEYVNAISTMDWKEVMEAVNDSRELLKAIWALDGEKVANGIDKAHREISILQYNDENSLSCTINLAPTVHGNIIQLFVNSQRKRVCRYLLYSKTESSG